MAARLISGVRVAPGILARAHRAPRPLGNEILPLPSHISVDYTSSQTQTHRCFATSSASLRIIKAQAQGRLTNHDIPHNTVQLVSPETGTLLPPQPLHTVLGSINLNTHFLLLVSTSPPTVRIKSLAEEAEAQARQDVKANERVQREKQTKEVQISWNSADGDIAMKLKVARSGIEKGNRLKVTFAPRTGRKKVQISPDRIEEILEMFEDGLTDIATKWRADEDEGKVKTCHWQPKEEVREEALEKTTAHVVESRTARMERKAERIKREQEKQKRAASRAQGQSE